MAGRAASHFRLSRPHVEPDMERRGVGRERGDYPCRRGYRPPTAGRRCTGTCSSSLWLFAVLRLSRLPLP